ncbi:MAG TPA: hypothetical protein VGZ48_04025 [Candidatus Acidoferrales bacterium]|nr:hypothetical protein [Candidatus Acidoferrales bacterium]
MPPRIKPVSPPRELARRIVVEMSRANFAPALLDGYAREFNRADVVAHFDRRRELEAILSREALLAIAAHIALTLAERNTPSRGPRSKSGARARLRPRPFIQWNSGTFIRELAAAIARESGWTLGDSVEFQSDLQIYISLSKAPAPARSPQGRAQVARHRSPFVDRCAILLDPSMLENASRAAAKLLPRIESLAEHLLEEMPTQKK